MSFSRHQAIAPILLTFLPLFLAVGSDARPAGPASQPAGGEVVAGKSPTIFLDAERTHRVMFLNDASGSMINKMATLKDQLGKTIGLLKPEQEFGVIFMQDKSCDRFNDKLVPAGAEQKQAAGKFLDRITTTGTTDPIPGIELAFKQKPDVLYLLTDGDFPDNDAVLKRIRELNKDKKVKVYTIAFVSQADTDTAFVDLLKTIASESGGIYAHVKEEEL